jgi:phospholipase C
VDEHGYGFRVPALLVSAWAKPGVVDHTQLDFTSILKFIAENWGLAPLAERDAAASSFFEAFDFTGAPRPPRFLPWERPNDVAADPPWRAGIVLAYTGALAAAAVLLARARAVPPPRDPSASGLEPSHE